MSLENGTKLGPYEILSPLGAGGMGEVYLATDSKLDRRVAIKVLPESMMRDPERVARFEREAKVLASLNHPNIAAIHGFDDSDCMRFLVMEYVEGETLADHVRKGPIAVEDALDIARQIAEALEAAHDQGVIHRDLKPANVMIRSDGTVKVLDFGLAKAMSEHPSGAIDANSPTITANFTQPGVVLGTAAYMSPEQARGRQLDKRTDIWSFGVVLYEMLTGISPFRGETISDSIGAILHKDADLDMLPTESAPVVRHVLTRCLQRDRKRRLRDIGDARLELECSPDPGQESGAPLSRRRAPAAIFALLLIVGGLIGALVGFRAAQAPPPRVAHLSIEPPDGARIRYSGDLAGPAVVSPDGTMIAFSAVRAGEPQRLWVRRLAAPMAREIRGTDGALFPFWSPDSASLGFFTMEELRRVDIATETSMTVCGVTEARGGSWTYDGRILLAPAFHSPLFIVDANGGTPRPITTLDKEKQTTHRWPFALPDGERFLFFASHRARTHRAQHEGIYIGYLDGRPPQKLLRTEFGGAYVDDHLLFVRDGVLLASRVDLDAAQLNGEPHVIARRVAADISTWHPQFSASAAGVLVFNRRASTKETSKSARDDVASFAFEGDVVRHYEQTGRLETTYAEGVPHSGMVLSPDGHSFALSVPQKDGSLDIWIYPTAWRSDMVDFDESQPSRTDAVMSASPRRLTFLDGSEEYSVWSPDGTEIAFARHDVKNAAPGIYRKKIGGGEETLLLAVDDVPVFPTDWTHDGKYLVFTRGAWQGGMNVNDIWVLPLEGGDPRPLVQLPLVDGGGVVSPDGRWLAYSSREKTRQDVYVIPFAPIRDDILRPRRWQVSLDGGFSPTWSADGKALYYVTWSGMLMELSVEDSSDSFQFSSPNPLFQSPWEFGSSYGVFPKTDGGTTDFVFNDTRQALDVPISVILNWQQLLVDE